MAVKPYKTTLFKVLVVFTILLLLMRLVAPYLIQNYINEKIDSTDGVSGYVSDVDLALLQGGYRIKKIKIFEEDEIGNTNPLLAVERLDLSISWAALINGNLVTNMAFYRPEVVVYDKDPNKEEINQKVKDETTWLGLANNLVLFSIDRLAINNGKLTLINNSDDGESATNLSNINGYITNITNAQNSEKSLVTGFNLEAAIMGDAKINFDGKLDPFSKKANFDINLELERFSVKSIESIIDFYTPFDFEAGSIDGAMELAAHDNQLEGYVKAGIYDLEIFSWREDIQKDDDGLFTLIFEGTSDLVSSFLENDDSELIAARVPISGKLDNTDISTFEAVISVLQNAFFDAFKMKVDNVISFESTKDKQEN